MCAYPLVAIGILLRVIVENFFYAWFFYRSFWPVIILLIPGFFRFCFLCKEWDLRKRKEMEEQFGECIMSVATGLRAETESALAFEGSAREFYIIGDCRKPETIQKAMRSALGVALVI